MEPSHLFSLENLFFSFLFLMKWARWRTYPQDRSLMNPSVQSTFPGKKRISKECWNTRRRMSKSLLRTWFWASVFFSSILSVLQARKSKIKVPVSLVPGEDSLAGLPTALFWPSSQKQKRKWSGGVGSKEEGERKKERSQARKYFVPGIKGLSGTRVSGGKD